MVGTCARDRCALQQLALNVHIKHFDHDLRLAARVLLYAPSHRQDSTYHSLCYTFVALAGTRNSSMGPHEGSIQRPIAQLANTLTTELHLASNLYERNPSHLLTGVDLRSTVHKLGA